HGSRSQHACRGTGARNSSTRPRARCDGRLEPSAARRFGTRGTRACEHDHNGRGRAPDDRVPRELDRARRIADVRQQHLPGSPVHGAGDAAARAILPLPQSGREHVEGARAPLGARSVQFVSEDIDASGARRHPRLDQRAAALSNAFPAIAMKPYSDACDRNRDPILNVIKDWFVAPGEVLEIGSGTGQHAVYFARQLPHLQWIATDRAENHAGIKAWLDEAQLPNVRGPLELDVNEEVWPVERVDYVFSANTAHIMSWPEVEKMFEGVGRVLRSGGVFCLYGPFNRDGQFTSE